MIASSPGILTVSSDAIRPNAVPAVDPPASASVTDLFRRSEQSVYRQGDRLFLVLLGLQWIAGIVLALTASPRSWAGASSQVHTHVYAAIFLGGLCCWVPMALCFWRPGEVVTRHAVAIGQTGFSALLIHLTMSRIETHFHVFGSLAFLACYRDWRVLATATAVVALDHVVRGIWFPLSVYGVLTASPWRVVEHAAWVVFEDIVLVWSCRVSRREMWRICEEQYRNACLRDGLEVKVQERTRELQAEIAERQRTETAIRASEERYRAVVESAPEFINTIDREGRILFVNRVLPGFEKAHVLGSPIYNYIAADSVERVRQLVAEVFESGEVRTYEVSGAGLHGVPAWYASTLGPIKTDGRVTSAILIAADITARKLAEEELLNAKETADAGNRAKSEFLATMSHEIRTPMNGVIGFTNLLLDTPLSPDQHEFATTIRSSGQSLLAIINDILDFSKIEANKLELENCPYALRPVIEEAAELMSREAEKKGLEIVLHQDQDTPDNLIGDPGRVRQILLNLLSNAIKFTEQGHVFVNVSVDSGSSLPSIRVSVSDTGIGIPADKQASLFQKFTQADASTTRRFGGTGLGLAISLRLAERMGGRMGFESTSGKGSTFWFTLCRPVEAPVPAGLPRADGLRGVRVIIVDDLEVNRRVLREQLKLWGVPHDWAASGAEALQKLRGAHTAGQPFHVALLDYLMPEMDGEMLGREMQRDPALRSTAMIMLTSGSQRGDAQRLLAAGFSAYLTKPVVRPALLLEAISRAANLVAPARPAAVRPSVAQPPVPPGAPPVHRRVLLVEDNRTNQLLAELFLKKLNCTVDLASDGREAIGMVRQLPYDCIFMDCQMPEMDGFEATLEIRRLGADRRVPIIALTADVMAADRERCIAAGMDDYISKPLHLDDLRRALERWAMPGAMGAR